MTIAIVLAAAAASFYAFTLGATDIGIIFVMVSGAFAMGIDGQ